ncbi:bifunctional diaminohydroxyphosphoribosylaminopyrimidine deaminase/5-amino-6-(5-phosphoribosylamino)uracil reductase RibD [Filimonas effusa]|uniref:Riboflavin biosynthesis protein RibD n=1 Tax=Filimonas effusa TaxID=2508721 RepID=A0A4Q1DD99_9BACT|nr:bifunctional diaminohydroxyphosphoribosylaminopyrimidine deaminase/5-amino-6-(5-phosphoribosylamino)uracil reductase RibD [Filimonas effusa]RXK87370.1 bifunctional diaminohydroxyphosphoribosylaminopyrimidine deaminase/5-amino-6-(5-phosphoribosylamino)uracil reductase RibD [Filimonas effusa]
MSTHELYMQRCIQLARLGAGQVAPNPMVGAVLVYEDRIIGEGYHAIFGQGHAEVNCINSVAAEDRYLIPLATIYVSLEPCAHYGKTPPCADLIIANRIRTVVIGSRDPFLAVNGKGIEKLQAAGISVVTGVLEKECLDLNKRFFTFHTQQRPYFILKWAQTANGAIGSGSDNRLLISNDFTNRIVHRWRNEESAILVGTNTALADDPLLTNRLWYGKSPVRLVIDTNLRLPKTLKLLSEGPPTIIFNYLDHSDNLDAVTIRTAQQALAAERSTPHIATGNNVFYYRLEKDEPLLPQISYACFRLQLLSVLVEGGAFLQQRCLNEGYWDEARVITNDQLMAPGGLKAPELPAALHVGTTRFLNDRIDFFLKPINEN